MSQPFLGEIRPVGFNFAPVGWAFCDGQLLSIDQNSALYALLGTTFGGDGVSTFALPDLRSRVPVGTGQGGGLQNYALGESFGSEVVSLNSTQVPAHSHALGAGGTATQNSPNQAILGTAFRNVYAQSGGFVEMDPTGSTGDGLPHENRQPFLGVSFIIALEGIFPARN